MPFVWIEPALYMSYKGVDVFHVYRTEVDVVRPFWYTFDSAQDDIDGVYDDPQFQFDISWIAGENDDHRTKLAQYIDWMMANKPEGEWPWIAGTDGDELPFAADFNEEYDT